MGLRRILEALKSARGLELFLLLAAVAALLVMTLGSMPEGTEMRGDEQRLERILSSIEGAGRVRVMLSGEDGEGGCVVAAEGARDISVALNLQRAVQTLTGLELDRIEIVKAE